MFIYKVSLKQQFTMEQALDLKSWVLVCLQLCHTLENSPGLFISSLVYMQPCESITDNLSFLLTQSHLQMTTRYEDNIQND